MVDEFMAVPAAPDIYACGDCAAVPDLTRPGQVCGMTAQHAQRQGKQVARNVAATLGKGKAKPCKHADLGFLVDLGGLAGAANPLHVPLSGPAANAVTRGYHLSAMSGNRMRVLTDWILNGITSPKRRRWTYSGRVRAARRRQTASLNAAVAVICATRLGSFSGVVRRSRPACPFPGRVRSWAASRLLLGRSGR